jgi:Ran GTPase-activating protein (RanGAP) involved in mRNA processing and transport
MWIADAIKRNASLKVIYLDKNCIRVEGVKCIAEAVKANTSLLEINLRENHIGAEGAK